MNHGKALLILCAGAVVGSVAGCVDPAPIDQTVVVRYEQAMAARSPASRANDKSIGLLQPPARPDIPSLRTTKDDKTGRTQLSLSLEEVVMRTLANAPEIRVVSFDPKIAREDVIKAASEFDYTFFGATNFNKFKQQIGTIGEASLGNTEAEQIGIKQKTITGATQQLAWTMTRVWDNSSFKLFQAQVEQQPAYQITQPLLRDAWPDFNLAKMNIAQVNEKSSVAAFRQKVEEVVADTVGNYWRLIQARRDLAIAEKLLAASEDTLEHVSARKDIDATQVQIKQAEAAVETRKAALIQATKEIYDAQDKLARSMSDAQVNLLADFDIVPTTEPATMLVQYDLTDQLLTGLAYNPQLEQARLAIESAAIDIRVAQNQTLPKLDFIAQVGLQSLQKTTNASFKELGWDFINYSFGTQFEVPIGDRGPLADLAQKRFAHQKAIAQLQDLADQMALAVKERMRQVQSAYEQMLAQRKALAANWAQLDALKAKEKLLEKLSPEFLQLELQAQESVATAARAEAQAVADYNVAMMDLSRVTGTVLQLQRIKVAMPAVMDEMPWPKEIAPAATQPWSFPPKIDKPIEGAPSTKPAGNGTTNLMPEADVVH